MKLWGSFSLFMLLTVFGHRAFGQSEGVRSVDLLRDDPRLSHTFTVESDEICVGDLLEQVSTQSGVGLRCRRWDGSGDIRVAAYCRGMTLAELMASVRSLLSHRDAEVIWSRDGKPGEYIYELQFPQNARLLAGRLRAETQAAFEKCLEVMTRLAALDPEERAKHVSDLSKAYMQKDDKLAREELSDHPAEKRMWSGLNLFARTLTPAQRNDLIAGGPSIQVKADDLPSGGREFIQGIWRAEGQFARSPGGAPEWSPEPKSVTFRVSRNGDFLTKTLVLDLGDLGGYGYAGGSPLNRAYQDKVRDLWIGLKDVLGVPSAVTLGGAAKPPAEDPSVGPDGRPVWRLAIPASPLQRRLREFAYAAHTGVLARISDTYNLDPGEVGKSIPNFLDRISTHEFSINYKWSDRTLLLEEARWFLTAERLPAWSSVKWFRDTMAARKGVLTFADLCSLSRRLTRAEMEFSPRICPSFSAIANYWELLRFCEEKADFRSAIVSERGLLIGPELAQVLRSSDRLSGYLTKPGIRAICFEAKPYSGAKPPSIQNLDFILYRFGYLTADGEKHFDFGFRMATTLPVP